jgi:enoyl-CoA hydratase
VSYVTHTRRESGVTILTADRPPANAMDVGLLRDIVAGVGELAADPPAAVVIAGREGFFSAGADLKAVPAYGPDEQREMVHLINAMALGVYALPCPVVAAITGHAIAGGLVLAICADLRVASDAGRYGLTEVSVGVPYPQAAIGVVREELAPGARRVLALGNQLHAADDLLRLGVFDEVLPAERVLPRAIELAERLAAMPADVYARTKRDLRAAALDAMRAAAAEDPLLDRWV